MAEISATDASKRFADMLDAVEHRGETFTAWSGAAAQSRRSPPLEAGGESSSYSRNYSKSYSSECLTIHEMLVCGIRSVDGA